MFKKKSIENMVEIKNLVLLGAGAMWPVYSGVLVEMVRRKALEQLECAVGVSSGAIAVALYLSVCRRSRAEQMRYAHSLPRLIHSRHLLFGPEGTDACESAIEFGNGLYNAQNVAVLIRHEMAQNLDDADVTLLQLRTYSNVDFKVLVYEYDGHIGNIGFSRPLVLDADVFPNLPVWAAVRASCGAFPLISPVRVRSSTGTWWVDPALFRGNADFARRLVSDRKGLHAIVSLQGLEELPWTFFSNVWNASFTETMLLWFMAIFRCRNHGTLRDDVFALCIDVPSFPFNFGFVPIQNIVLHKLGTFECARFLRKMSKLAPVERSIFLD